MVPWTILYRFLVGILCAGQLWHWSSVALHITYLWCGSLASSACICSEISEYSNFQIFFWLFTIKVMCGVLRKSPQSTGRLKSVSVSVAEAGLVPMVLWVWSLACLAYKSACIHMWGRKHWNNVSCIWRALYNVQPLIQEHLSAGKNKFIERSLYLSSSLM